MAKLDVSSFISSLKNYEGENIEKINVDKRLSKLLTMFVNANCAADIDYSLFEEEDLSDAQELQEDLGDDFCKMNDFVHKLKELKREPKKSNFVL